MNRKIEQLTPALPGEWDNVKGHDWHGRECGLPSGNSLRLATSLSDGEPINLYLFNEHGCHVWGCEFNDEVPNNIVIAAVKAAAEER